MKVLVVNPPAYFGNHLRHFIQGGSRWSFSIFVPPRIKEHYLPYPFNLGYTLSLLKTTTDAEAKGIDACALDMDDKEFVKEIKSHNPDMIVLDVPTITFPLVMPLLKEIKQDVGCEIVLVGGHVTALSSDIMKQYEFIDYCLLAEYEHTVKELVVRKLKSNDNVDDIKGIVYRSNGEIKTNHASLQTFNLDDMPYPDRDDFSIRAYHDFETAGRPQVQMLTSLGCPYRCSFCMPVRVMYQDSPTYRRRQPEKIVDEMEYTKEKYHAKSAYFDDDTFSVDKHRVAELCNVVIKRKLDMPWTAMGDVTLKRDNLKLLSQAGCVGVKFGVETSSIHTLDIIRKNFVKMEMVKDFVKSCEEFGIWSHATFIIGLPNEKREDTLKTIEFAKELNPDSVQFSIATPFPGTPFYEEAKVKGWLDTDDFTRYDGGNYSVLNYPTMDHKEIEALHRKALREWYLKAIVNEIKHPKRIHRIIKSKSIQYATRKTLSHIFGAM